MDSVYYVYANHICILRAMSVLCAQIDKDVLEYCNPVTKKRHARRLCFVCDFQSKYRTHRVNAPKHRLSYATQTNKTVNRGESVTRVEHANRLHLSAGN